MILQNPGWIQSCKYFTVASNRTWEALCLQDINCPFKMSTVLQFIYNVSFPAIQNRKKVENMLLSMSTLQDKTMAESKPTPGFHLFSVCLLGPDGLWCCLLCFFFIGLSPYCWFRKKAAKFLTFSEWSLEDLSQVGQEQKENRQVLIILSLCSRMQLSWI